jgi:hypothetical protein
LVNKILPPPIFSIGAGKNLFPESLQGAELEMFGNTGCGRTRSKITDTSLRSESADCASIEDN